LVTQVCLGIIDVLENLHILEVGVAAHLNAHRELENFTVELGVVENQMRLVEEVLQDRRAQLARHVLPIAVVDGNVDALDAIWRDADASDLNLHFVHCIVYRRIVTLVLLNVDEDARVQSNGLSVNRYDREHLVVCSSVDLLVTRLILKDSRAPLLKLLWILDEAEGLLCHPLLLETLLGDASKVATEHRTEILRQA